MAFVEGNNSNKINDALNSTEHGISIFQLLTKTNMLKNKTFLAFKLSDVVLIMLINVKMYLGRGGGGRCSLKNFKMANMPQLLSFKHIKLTPNNTQDIDKRNAEKSNYKELCCSVHKNE